jgi:hypothetical protein
MKNIIDFILESKGQRISKRAGNRPYDPNKHDKLLKNRDSRPERAQKLRETKVDKQVKEFCSALVNDFIVKFYNLIKTNESLISFYHEANDILREMDEYNTLNDIEPKTIPNGCVFLYSGNDDMPAHKLRRDFILQYNPSNSFTTILNNLKFYYKYYYYNNWIDNNWIEKIKEEDEDYKIDLKCDKKFIASVLHKLRKHDLAKSIEKSGNYSGSGWVSLFGDIFDDVADNYNKNYFADKFKEFETAYNEVLANW